MPQTDFTCPACGEEVHPNAKSCANCGTRPEAGWASGGEIIDGIQDLGIPDDDFDYDEFIAREFDGKGKSRDSPAVPKIWVITALVLLLVILILILGGLW